MLALAAQGTGLLSPRPGRLSRQLPFPGPQRRAPLELLGGRGKPGKTLNAAGRLSPLQTPLPAAASVWVTSSLGAPGGRGRSQAGALRGRQAPPPDQLSRVPGLRLPDPPAGNPGARGAAGGRGPAASPPGQGMSLPSPGPSSTTSLFVPSFTEWSPELPRPQFPGTPATAPPSTHSTSRML